MINNDRELLTTFKASMDRLIKSIIISIGKLISVVILSSFLIIISIINKYIACVVVLGYIIVYIYNKVVDFVNRLPNQFEDKNPNQIEPIESVKQSNTSAD